MVARLAVRELRGELRPRRVPHGRTCFRSTDCGGAAPVPEHAIPATPSEAPVWIAAPARVIARYVLPRPGSLERIYSGSRRGQEQPTVGSAAFFLAERCQLCPVERCAPRLTRRCSALCIAA